MDCTGLGLTFCTYCIHDTKHATVILIQVVDCVCCYSEEALQPPIPNPQKQKWWRAREKRGGSGSGCGLDVTV